MQAMDLQPAGRLPIGGIAERDILSPCYFVKNMYGVWVSRWVRNKAKQYWLAFLPNGMEAARWKCGLKEKVLWQNID